MPGELGTLTGASVVSPLSDETTEVTTVLPALRQQPSKMAADPPAETPRAKVGGASSGRHALLALLGCQILAGVIAVYTLDGDSMQRPAKSTESRADVVFGSAHSGDCLAWPINTPSQPSFVSCSDDHLFEVAQTVDMRGFQQPCQLAVQRYLGPQYDPNSKFTISVLWPGDAAATLTNERRLLCGLQLLGPDGQPMPFKGMVAELDQSKLAAPAPEQQPAPSPAPPSEQPPPPSNELRPTTPPSPVDLASQTAPGAAPAPAATPAPTAVPPDPAAIPSTAPSPAAAPAPPAAPAPSAESAPTSEAPQPPVIQIPGLAPITLPVFPPPPPAEG